MPDDEEGEETLVARPHELDSAASLDRDEKREDLAAELESDADSQRLRNAEDERGAESLGFEELEVVGLSGPGYGDSEEPSRRNLDDADLAPEPRLPSGLMELEPPGSEGAAPFDRPLDMSTGVGAGERPRQRSGAPWVWLLVVLAAAVAGLLYWRSRGPAASAPGSPLTTTSTPTEAALLSTATPAPLVAAPAPAAPAIPTSTRSPAVSPTSRRPQPTAAPAAVPRGRQKWLERAARDRRKADADRRARFTIQLELVCQEDSLFDAWKYDRPSGTMWLLTTPYQGQTCFRVLWGRYPTREAAQRALTRAPAFFTTPSNHPLVVPVR